MTRPGIVGKLFRRGGREAVVITAIELPRHRCILRIATHRMGAPDAKGRKPMLDEGTSISLTLEEAKTVARYLQRAIQVGDVLTTKVDQKASVF